MRTTIRLPDDLLRCAKARAAESGESLTTYIEHAVRDRVERPRPASEDVLPLPILTGTGWVRPGVNMDKVSELFEQEDLEDGKFR